MLRCRLQRWLGWAYRQRQTPPPPAAAAATSEQRRARARARWRLAGRSILASQALASEAGVLGDPLAPPADRLHALVQLAVGVATAAPAGRRRLASALLARQAARLQSLWEQLQDELYLTGGRAGGRAGRRVVVFAGCPGLCVSLSCPPLPSMSPCRP